MNTSLERWFSNPINKMVVVNYLYANQLLTDTIFNIIDDYSSTDITGEISDELGGFNVDILYWLYENTDSNPSSSFDNFVDYINDNIISEVESIIQNANQNEILPINQNNFLLDEYADEFRNREVIVDNKHYFIANKKTLDSIIVPPKKYIKFSRFVYKTYKKLTKKINAKKVIRSIYKELDNVMKRVTKYFKKTNDPISNVLIRIQVINYFINLYLFTLFNEDSVARICQDYKKYLFNNALAAAVILN